MVVISGRELDDLRRKVDVDGLTYAACHGLHVMHADGQTYRHTISQGKSKKDQIILATGRGILAAADFWVPHEIES